jgi:hypothetical protein
MGLFRDQAMRLLRERWGSPNELAEEIFAILTSDVPVRIDSPVVITAEGSDRSPPLTVRNFGQDDAMVRFERRRLPDVAISYDGGDGDGEEVTEFYGDGSTESIDPETGEGTPSTQGGGGLAGVVVSGSGDTYQVDTYPQGLSAPPVRRTVRQLQIAEGEAVPAGTFALVVQAGGEFYMQVPTWL